LAEGKRDRIVATFNDYPGMMQALRERVKELGVHGESLDEFCGLSRGYSSKLVSLRPPRRLGMVSWGPLVCGLGLRMQFIEDAEATALVRSRVKQANPSYVRIMPAAASIIFTARMLKRIRRLGGQARMARLTAKERSKLARKAALARWRKT
jgi:hypothetical protein